MSNPQQTVRQPGGRRPGKSCTSGCACDGCCNSLGAATGAYAVTLSGMTGLLAPINGTWSVPYVSDCFFDLPSTGTSPTDAAIAVVIITVGGICTLQVQVFPDFGNSASFTWQAALGPAGTNDCRNFSQTLDYVGYGDQDGNPDPGYATGSTATVFAAEGGGKPCCCGGANPNKCVRMCISGCAALHFDLWLCWSDANSRYEVNNPGGFSARFHQSGGSFTAEWSCDDWATTGSHTFAGGEVTLDGGDRTWSAPNIIDNSGCCTGSQITVKLGKNVSCPGRLCDTTCFNASLPAAWDVLISAALTNLLWDACDQVSGGWTIDETGGCQWSGSFLAYPTASDMIAGEFCGPCTKNVSPPYAPSCALSIFLELLTVTGGCQFHLHVACGCSCHDSDTSSTVASCVLAADYYSEVYAIGSDPPSAFTVTGPGASGGSCNGSLPGSIDLEAA